MLAHLVAPPGTPVCARMLGTLRCTQSAGHPPGCTFESTSGVPDAHFASSGE